ncbi:uncharacterized protein YkwD [Spinactinospora alkalitolerans]|uniref:Uncharacterized protein YkwD n=1 Tax=Spinactinospora alkalitolerans TaxID=687207 RepID=A0A852U0I2_9ACTN|nr:CAP domain-containing protein [Spinactinospora alkalitolerans]NYE49055.1 uncharacterized protein YkwD [Spinactinospora alkalitolerans]
MPVGLGLAAALILASPPSGDIEQQADDLNAVAPDEALPPTGFFPDSSPAESTASPAPAPPPESDPGATGGGEATGGTELRAEASPEQSERPSDDSDDSDDSGSGGGDSDGGGPGGGSGSGPGSGGDGGASALAAQVVDLTNAERADAGCAPLRIEERLVTASRSHSDDMAARDYMAHESPEGEGPGERAAEAGYDAWSGENVAAGYSSAEAVMEGWMNSPGHRRNILDCDSRAIGVAETDGYWTQMFGRK